MGAMGVGAARVAMGGAKTPKDGETPDLEITGASAGGLTTAGFMAASVVGSNREVAGLTDAVLVAVGGNKSDEGARAEEVPALPAAATRSGTAIDAKTLDGTDVTVTGVVLPEPTKLT